MILRAECLPQIAERASRYRVGQVARDLGDRPEDEGVAGEVGAGQFQPRLVQHEVVIEQQVQIEAPGGVTRRRARPFVGVLDGVQGADQGAGVLVGIESYRPVIDLRALKSDRVRFVYGAENQRSISRASRRYR